MLTVADLGSWLGRVEEDDENLQLALAYVNGLLDELPDVPRTDTGELKPHARAAAVMLVSRIYRRRNSAAGVETVGDMGGALYVSRYDPDIARVLGVDGYQRPRVG